VLIAIVLCALLVATAALGASALRPASTASWLLTGYALAAAEVVLLAVVLSPFRAYDRPGLAGAEAVLTCVAAAAWWRTGRPLPDLRGPRELASEIRHDPVLLLLAGGVVAGIVYGLFVGLAAAPDTWDSLTYHLSRAAWWRQHDGVAWIPGVIDERVNAFPPNAELAVLYTLVAAASDRVATLPQLVSELALLVAVYGIACRLGSTRRAALFAALVFATLPMVALQSSTTQTDLVIAALAASTAYFLLGSATVETLLAGLAMGLALGAKLTVVLVLPVLIGLAALRGRAQLAWFGVASTCSFLVLSSWVYLRNVDHTGSPLGEGVGRVEHEADPSLVGSLSTAIRVSYRFLDLSGLGVLDRTAAVAGAALALAAALGCVVLLPRRGVLATTARLYGAALLAPFAAWLAVTVLAFVVSRSFAHSGIPANPAETTGTSFAWGVNESAHEDVSYFGPLGALLLLVALVVLYRALRGRTTRERALLALSIPVFVVGIALTYRYNAWLGRFFVVPVALTAPLLAVFHRRRPIALAVAVTALCWLALTHADNQLKPTGFGGTTPIWKLSRAEALALTFGGRNGLDRAVTELDRAIGVDGCVGAYLGIDQASYPLFGPSLDRRVVFLDRDDPAADAERRGLGAVVIRPVSARSRFEGTADWTVRLLGDGYWALATRTSHDSGCRS
jgi:4-amino-4-deoxy-L-arabinose transferase-like glycosyltransferase